jgi:2-deoxy-D-gluconate 3-dehydrogenase
MILDMFSLQGKVAVVTGASRGLGQGIAVGLAEAGADIVAVASSSKVEETAEEVHKLGRRALGITAELREIEPIPHVVERALAEFGQIDILVNCAGIIRRTPAIDCPEDDWDAVLNLNVKSMYFMSQPWRRRW